MDGKAIIAFLSNWATYIARGLGRGERGEGRGEREKA
jgi:hypothetical protein